MQRKRGTSTVVSLGTCTVLVKKGALESAPLDFAQYSLAAAINDAGQRIVRAGQR
jgi:hypothetical protein